jgi:hypothetical protein
MFRAIDVAGVYRIDMQEMKTSLEDMGALIDLHALPLARCHTAQ